MDYKKKPKATEQKRKEPRFAGSSIEEQRGTKQRAFVKLWNVLYPVLAYFVLMNVVIYMEALFFHFNHEKYAQYYMMLQTVAGVVSIPFVYSFYRRDKLYATSFHQRTSRQASQFKNTKQNIVNALETLLCGAVAGIALNNIIALTNLSAESAGYQEVTAQFFAGAVIFELLGACLIIPLVEELLYRGVVYARMQDLVERKVAAILSALLFGAFHFNLVQFIYAGILGLLMTACLEKSHHLYGAIFAHMGANFTSILRAETNLFDWMNAGRGIYAVATTVALVICILLLMPKFSTKMNP
ncbi:CPBP family intramembrane metalloprotease [Lachnospiraceae bacterium ZAX-1]